MSRITELSPREISAKSIELLDEMSGCIAPAAVKENARRMGLWKKGQLCLQGPEHEPYLALFWSIACWMSGRVASLP